MNNNKITNGNSLLFSTISSHIGSNGSIFPVKIVQPGSSFCILLEQLCETKEPDTQSGHDTNITIIIIKCQPRWFLHNFRHTYTHKTHLNRVETQESNRGTIDTNDTIAVLQKPLSPLTTKMFSWIRRTNERTNGWFKNGQHIGELNERESTDMRHAEWLLGETMWNFSQLQTDSFS